MHLCHCFQKVQSLRHQIHCLPTCSCRYQVNASYLQQDRRKQVGPNTSILLLSTVDNRFNASVLLLSTVDYRLNASMLLSTADSRFNASTFITTVDRFEGPFILHRNCVALLHWTILHKNCESLIHFILKCNKAAVTCGRKLSINQHCKAIAVQFEWTLSLITCVIAWPNRHDRRRSFPSYASGPICRQLRLLLKRQPSRRNAPRTRFYEPEKKPGNFNHTKTAKK